MSRRRILRKQKGLLLAKKHSERYGACSRPNNGKDVHAGRTLNKNKKTAPVYQCPVGCGDKVSFGAASNCVDFRRMSKAERRDRVKKYYLCRKCLKYLKRVKHNVQDCPAQACGNCKKDHNSLICPEERREQKLHKVQDEKESDDDDDQDFYGDMDLFEENLQFHLIHKGPADDDGDDYQDDYQNCDEEEEDQTGNGPEEVQRIVRCL